MSFERFLESAAIKPEFGQSRFVKNFKDRQHVSRVELDSDKGCKYLSVGEVYYTKYSNMGVFYVGVVDLSFDAILSIYDVNSQKLLVCRFYKFTADFETFLNKELKRMANANFEARVIGMQNGDKTTAYSVVSFLRAHNLVVVEVDIFGDETRHLAIDVKRGVTFNVLAGNKPYKPGELKNDLTVEQFERALMSTPKQGAANYTTTDVLERLNKKSAKTPSEIIK